MTCRVNHLLILLIMCNASCAITNPLKTDITDYTSGSVTISSVSKRSSSKRLFEFRVLTTTKNPTSRRSIDGSEKATAPKTIRHFEYYDVSEEEVDPGKDEKDDLWLMRIFIHGNISEIKKLPRDRVISCMDELKHLRLSTSKIQTIWAIIKEQRPAAEIKLAHLKLMGDMISSIPDMDIYELNTRDPSILNYLGTHKAMRRRQAAILSYALLKILPQKTKMLDAENINIMKGILCGFSPYNLSFITPMEFRGIHQDVFQNLHACSYRQLRYVAETFGDGIRDTGLWTYSSLGSKISQKRCVISEGIQPW